MSNIPYKPLGYNSLSPYLIVDDAPKLVDLLKAIFDAQELRRFQDDNGRIVHVELKLDDSVLMIADSNPEYPAHKTMLHVYVPDVHSTFDKAMKHSCQAIEEPMQREGDPDVRGSFYDFAGNYWAIGTQK